MVEVSNLRERLSDRRGRHGVESSALDKCPHRPGAIGELDLRVCEERGVHRREHVGGRGGRQGADAVDEDRKPPRVVLAAVRRRRHEPDAVTPNLLPERLRPRDERRPEGVRNLLTRADCRSNLMHQSVEVVVRQRVPDEEHVAGQEHRLHDARKRGALGFEPQVVVA